VQRSLCGTTTNVGGPHGGQIGIPHRPEIAERELHKGVRLARQPDKFDIGRLLAVEMHHRAEIAAAETILREIALKDDGIEFVNVHRELPDRP
jgi:hypothetical protein